MNTKRYAFILLALFFISLKSYASNDTLHVLASYPDYDLSLKHTRTDTRFDDSAEQIEIRDSRVGLSIADHLTDWLKIRLSGGVISFSLDGSSRVENFDPSGEFLSLSLEAYFPTTSSFAVALATGYEYNAVEDDDNRQNLRYRISKLDITLTGVYHIMPSFSLRFGVSGLILEGRERFRTATTSVTRDFESLDSLSGVLQAVFHTRENGHIGITASGGAQNALSVYFRYAY